MADRDRRELRELKRVVKRLGNQHARREVKRRLSEDPTDEALTDDPDYGRFESGPLNGMDRDATRKKRDDHRHAPPLDPDDGP